MMADQQERDPNAKLNMWMALDDILELHAEEVIARKEEQYRAAELLKEARQKMAGRFFAAMDQHIHNIIDPPDKATARRNKPGSSKG